jgi:hypothetical protein
MYSTPKEPNMSEMTAPESRARLGYLLSEMLALPTLPADLSQVINDHLQRQLSLVNILKPEYCVRLYPVLAELTELAAKDIESQASDEVATLSQEPADANVESVSEEAPAETVNGAAHDAFSETSTESGCYGE